MKNSAYMLEPPIRIGAISREVVYNLSFMEIALRENQKDIIIGSILGDGYIEFDGFYGSRLQIKQSDQHRDYVFWFYERLENLCKSAPKQRFDTKQWYFSTRHLNVLTELRKIFYPNGKKIVPENTGNFLTSPLSLAVWYMDDGRLDFREKYHCSIILNTDSFELKQVNMLGEILKNNFGITSTIHNSLCRGKRYPKIYIGKESRDRFFSLVKPFIVNCFQYKLPPTYRLTPQRLSPLLIADEIEGTR